MGNIQWAVDRLYDETMRETPEFVMTKTLEKIMHGMMGQGSAAGLGVFSDLVVKVWRVSAMTVRKGVDGETVYSVSLIDANPPEKWQTAERVFAVTGDEFEELELDDLIHVSLRREPGVL